MSKTISEIAQKHSNRLQHRSANASEAQKMTLWNYDKDKHEPREVTATTLERGEKRRKVDAILEQKRFEAENAEVWS